MKVLCFLLSSETAIKYPSILVVVATKRSRFFSIRRSTPDPNGFVVPALEKHL
jgi:hypothetical protein